MEQGAWSKNGETGWLSDLGSLLAVPCRSCLSAFFDLRLRQQAAHFENGNHREQADEEKQQREEKADAAE